MTRADSRAVVSAEVSPRDLPAGFAVAVGLSLILPLLNYYREYPLPDFVGEWLSALSFFVGALFLVVALPRRNLIASAPFLVTGLLLGLLAVHVIRGVLPFRFDAWVYSAYFLLFCFAVLVGQALRSAGLEHLAVRRLAWALVIAALFNLSIQLLQVLRIENLFAPFAMPLVESSKCRIYGNVAQANHANTLAWAAIVSVFYLVGSERLKPWLGAAFLAMLLASSALTGSRMAWLSLGLVSALSLTWRSWPLRGMASKVRAVIAMATGLAIATYATSQVLPYIDASCADTFTRLADHQEAGNAIRKDLAEQALMVWQSAPWIGAGAGQFAASTYVLDNSTTHRPLDTYAHNDALQTLAEFGLIGAGALAVFFFLVLLSLWRSRRRLSSADAAVVAWMGVIGTHSMLEYPLRYVHFLQLFGLSVGLLVGAHWIGRRVAVPVRAALLSLALAGVLGCVLLGRDFPRLDRLYWMVQIKQDNGIASTPELVERIREAASEIRYFDAYAAYSVGQAVPLTDEDLQQKIADTERLLARSPQPVTIARRVVLAALEKDFETARLHIRKLFVFYPRHAPELVEQMRAMVKERPESFAPLAPVLEEELARAPRPRW